MKKYFLGIIVIVLLLASVIAYSLSMRGSKGNIDFIGDDFNLIPYKIEFSLWYNDKGQGIGSLEVIGKTDSGERVVLIVRFDKNGAGSGKGTVTYYKESEGMPKRLETNVNYSYNPLSGLIRVSGVGGINFQISNIEPRYLKGSNKVGCEYDGDYIEDYYSDNYCLEGNVVRDLHDFSCIENKRVENVISELIEDCGEDYCEQNENYCIEGNVYHLVTCYEQGCLDRECYVNSYEYDELVEKCSEDYYSENYCVDSEVYHDLHDFSCVEGGCVENVLQEVVEECSNSCLDGGCVSERVHDVGLIDFSNAVNKIRLKHNDGGDYILENPAQLNCNEKYKIWIKVENQGDYTENVTFNGSIDVLSFNHNPKNNLAPGDDSLKYKTVQMDLPAGLYNIIVEAIINNDINLSNNLAEREIEIIC